MLLLAFKTPKNVFLGHNFSLILYTPSWREHAHLEEYE